MERLHTEAESIEPTQDFSELLTIVEKLEEISLSRELAPEEIVEQSKALVHELLSHIEDDFHLVLSDDINTLYAEMNSQNLLARVESVKRVVECLAHDMPITVGEGGEHYANSVTADAEGLRIAMAEAEAIGPVRLLMGLDLKALVGFTNDHVKVSEIAENEFDLRDTALRHAYCRHLEGSIQKEDIRYMVMRIPRSVFPREMMSDIERKQPSAFIFRGVKIQNDSVSLHDMQQAA